MENLPIQQNFFEPIISYITNIRCCPQKEEVVLTIKMPGDNIELDNNVMLKYFKWTRIEFSCSGHAIFIGELIDYNLGLWLWENYGKRQVYNVTINYEENSLQKYIADIDHSIKIRTKEVSNARKELPNKTD